MASSTGPADKGYSPKVDLTKKDKDDKPKSIHADREPGDYPVTEEDGVASIHADRSVAEIEEQRRSYEQAVQGKAPEFQPKVKDEDGKVIKD